jgi:hypothetical protein
MAPMSQMGQRLTSLKRETGEPRERLVVVVRPDQPYWDSNIVPRYRYRPQDDRVDPYGPPVVPVIRYGPQEEVLPAWSWTPGYYRAP